MTPVIGISRYLLKLVAMIIAGLTTGAYASAQEYTYIQYDVKDGLASSTVYDICQDKDGFIWFSTDAGVSRFDGTNFKNFTTADGLPETEVIRLFADSKGRVWMAPFKSSICYYYKGKIHNPDNDAALRNLDIQHVVTDFAENHDGDIALSTGKSGYVIRSDTVIDRFPRSIAWLDDLRLNTTPSGDAFLFRASDSIFTFSKGRITAVEKYKDTNKFQRDVFRKLKMPARPTIHSLMPQKKKVVFVNTYSGAWMVDTTTYDRYQDVFLKDKQISHTLIDNEKNIWFSTLGEGVFKLASREFKTWNLTAAGPTEVTSLEKFGNRMLVGTNKGMLLSVTGSDIDTLQYKGIKYVKLHEITRDRIMTLKYTRNKTIIAGFDGFMIMQRGNSKKTNFFVASNKSIEEIDDSTLLAATSRNLLLIRTSDLATLDTLTSYRSTAASYYNGAYYMGTLNGLYIITKDKRRQYAGDIHPALRHRISYFAKTKDGHLWVATYGSGVVCMKANKVVHHITAEQGISSNTCRALFIRDNYLWVGTDKGLNKIDISHQPWAITTYNTGDGLPSNIINAVYADGDSIYVGSPGGLTVFNEKKVVNNSKCNLQILNILVSNVSQPINNSYHLKYRENSLKIYYAGISFKTGGDLWYRYRLKGLTNNWDSTHQTVLEYPSLPPGDYQFEMIAINRKGVVSNPLCINFYVATPFWQTLPFQILVIAVAILLTWLLVAWRFSITRKQEQEKTAIQQRLNDLEQMALRAQMNPHFIFNCLNSIQNFIINNNLEASNQYLTEFAHLIRQTLDISEKGTITVTKEITYLKRYLELEKMRFGHSFTYSILVDEAIDPDLTQIPTMILQPYIENSIRHGIRLKQDGPGLIEIKFLQTAEDFICIIQDNGIGRKKAAEFKSQLHVEYQSKGMSLTAERINILNRQLPNPITIDIIDLTNSHNQPAGTRITIRFPGNINFKPVRNDSNRNY